MMSEVSLGLFNYLTIIIYMVAVVGMGYWFSRRENTSEEYLLGGRRIPWWAVGISYYMSITSTISMVMVPGEIYNNGLSLWMMQFVIPHRRFYLGFFSVCGSTSSLNLSLPSNTLNDATMPESAS